MSTNRLLCLSQALTFVAAGALISFAVCVATTDVDVDLTDILLAVLVASVFACTCLLAAMLNGNRKVMAELRDELDQREKFAEAAAARALVAFAQGADGPDAEVLQLHR